MINSLVWLHAMHGTFFGTTDHRGSRHSGCRGIIGSLLLLLVFHSGIAGAEWTGVTLDLANTDSDWKYRNQVREARNSELSFSIEERTASGLAIGARIGYFDMRLVAPDDTETLKFDGQYFGIYLRHDLAIAERLSLHSGLGLKYASGTESGDAEDQAEIDWTETDVEIGIGIRAGNLRIMPFAAWNHVDGDISDENGTSVFDLVQSDTQGIRFDLYVEQTAFVRLELVTGSRSGGTLVFARRY